MTHAPVKFLFGVFAGYLGDCNLIPNVELDFDLIHMALATLAQLALFQH